MIETPLAATVPAPAGRTVARLLTLLIVGGPLVVLAVAVPVMWGDRIHARDLGAALVMFVISGHGISIGYHRLFAHASFVAARPVKLALAAAGSMAVEGSVIGWVATHRRHHRFSDRAGDPHSPHVDGDSVLGLARGLVHAHAGWLFRPDPTAESTYAPDLLADPDLVRMSRWWGAFAIGSLLVPFGVGWLWTGRIAGGLSMFFWAGVVRMALLHHVTWSVNSICHVIGERPFRTHDHSANVAALGVLSMGESFHNLHHSMPRSARHGVLRHQPDSSARIIRWMECVGWVHDVRWPSVERVRTRLSDPGSFDMSRLPATDRAAANHPRTGHDRLGQRPPDRGELRGERSPSWGENDLERAGVACLSECVGSLLDLIEERRGLADRSARLARWEARLAVCADRPAGRSGLLIASNGEPETMGRAGLGDRSEYPHAR